MAHWERRASILGASLTAEALPEKLTVTPHQISTAKTDALPIMVTNKIIQKQKLGVSCGKNW